MVPAAQSRSQEIGEFLCSPQYFTPHIVKKLLQHELYYPIDPGLYLVFKRALDAVSEATANDSSVVERSR